MPTPLELVDKMLGRIASYRGRGKALKSDLAALRDMIGKPNDISVSASLTAQTTQCPLARVASKGGANNNRAVAPDGRTILPIGTHCIKHQCQMWDGEDCGLKAKVGGMSAMFDSYLASIPADGAT